ncbi:hypothetical protein IWW55_004489, partial [Coemansia sp. RSA 2706]
LTFWRLLINVLDNCLLVQGKALAMCSYSGWVCKCQAHQSIAGYFYNCPSDEAHTTNEGQVAVFCNTESVPKKRRRPTQPRHTQRHRRYRLAAAMTLKMRM